MKIRQLSDLHLERGPFTYEDQGEDVVVLAGDISVGTSGIEWAKTIPKLIIYVAGNHEHWGSDIYDNLNAMRKAAKGSNVHFLENDQVNLTINGETVRFLGCTLWTDYGKAHCENHPVRLEHNQNPQKALMHHAMGIMRDFTQTTAKAWWSPKNEKKYDKVFNRTTENSFNPLVAYDIHAKSRKWLEGELAKECPHQTVVVTHHAPSYQSLLQADLISKEALEQNFWRPTSNDNYGLYRVAGYASDLDKLMGRSSWSGSGVDLWLHGHTHTKIQYAMAGTVISCNPRGYYRDSAKYPESGDCFDFERNLVIDTGTVLSEMVIRTARKMLEVLPQYLDDVKAHQPYLVNKDEIVVSLAGHHIADQSKKFNLAVRSALDYLNDALKKHPGYSTKMESNDQRAKRLGFVDNSYSFSVNESFWIIDPFGRKTNPKKWGSDVASGMTGIISDLDEKLDQCVRELSEGKADITIIKSAF